MLKLVKGWRRISNQGGFINETTGQTLVISKKEFSQTFCALLFAGQQTDKKDGMRVSPEYASAVKAEAYALQWMEKHPNGFT
jgi:hypothetical protein